MSIFEKQQKVVNTEKKRVRWKLYFDGNDLRSSVTSVPTAIGGCIGANGSEFTMGLDSDVFGPNDMIILEGLAEIPLLCKSQPEPNGMEYLYTWVCVDPDEVIYDGWIKTDTQVKGQIGSLIGEAQIERGNVHWTSGMNYIEFEVPMTSMGWKMKITNDAWMAAQHFMINPIYKQYMDLTDGNPILFASYDAKFKDITDKQLDLWLAYGVAAKRFASNHLDLITENRLDTGPGWYQYLRSATYMEYNVHANILKYISNYVPVTWNDKVAPADRILDVYTGSGGLRLVQQAGEELDTKGVLQTAEYHYTSEKPFFEGRKAVAIGAKQYRALYLDPFGLVRFHYLPFLDNTSMDSRKWNGFPYQSYEFIIFNDGRGDAREENVYITRNETDSGYGYSTGTWTPTGHALKNGNALKYHNGLGDEKAFNIIRDETIGMVVKDPGYFTWIRPILK